MSKQCKIGEWYVQRWSSEHMNIDTYLLPCIPAFCISFMQYIVQVEFVVVQAHQTPVIAEIEKVYRVSLQDFGMVWLYQTFSTRRSKVYRVYTYVVVCGRVEFRVVQAHQTPSNLLVLHHCRDGKAYRVPLQEFKMVQLYRTFSTWRSKVYRVLMQ